MAEVLPKQKDLPVGDIQLYDDYAPALAAGNWWIAVDHTVSAGGASPLTARQEFVVSAPQFSLDPAVIVNQYPPAGSTGRFGRCLPHIVLKDPLLPWERKPAEERQPWLALLVLTDAELVGAAGSPTRTQVTTVGSFLKAEDRVYKPHVIKQRDIADSDQLSYIQITPAVFRKVVPYLGELRYLAHCRQVNTGDKAIIGLNEHGLYSVVLANRFPESPADETAAATKNIVHLVSLEGLQALLTPKAALNDYDTVVLVSLASWTFTAQRERAEDFADLMEAMVGAETDQNGQHPERLWLRRPLPSFGTPDPVQTEVLKRLSAGFVPLAYHSRTGEESFGWYRGPLTPGLPALLAKSGQVPAVKSTLFYTADAALAYQQTYGIFDFSLAAAWEIGRAVALADRVFGQQLLDFRRRGHRLTDTLLQHVQREHLTAEQIAEIDLNQTVQREVLALLQTNLLQAVGNVSKPAGLDQSPTRAGTPNKTAGELKADITAFLRAPAAQEKLAQLVAEDLAPIAQWLARLLLLYPVPFDYLVPDPLMLPTESIRFFYLDENWLGALLDGALSLGTESSRDTFFAEVTRDLLHSSAYAAARNYRSKLLGADPAETAGEGVTSGLLLRSQAVTGWPNLAVRAYDAEHNLLKLLRMDHLSPSVLLCLFWGVPELVEISEPQEGFRCGVDDNGRIPLRWPLAGQGGSHLLGEQITGRFVTVDGGCMRSPDSRVLNLDAAGPNGLVALLTAELSNLTDPQLGGFGPADLVIQLIKSPATIQFLSPAGQ